MAGPVPAIPRGSPHDLARFWHTPAAATEGSRGRRGLARSDCFAHCPQAHPAATEAASSVAWVVQQPSLVTAGSVLLPRVSALA